MICITIKVEKRKKIDMNFLFSVSFFYFCGETNKYFILHQKNILRCYMYLYDKYKDLF